MTHRRSQGALHKVADVLLCKAPADSPIDDVFELLFVKNYYILHNPIIFIYFLKFFANFGIFLDIGIMENVDLRLGQNALNISTIQKFHTLLRCGKVWVWSVDFYFLKISEGKFFLKSSLGDR